MAEYIEREVAENAIASITPSMSSPDGCSENDHLVFAAQEMCADVIQVIHNLPNADVAPVRHGKWILVDKSYGEYECSVCHARDSDCSDAYGVHIVLEQKHCPHCGARMDLEDEA